jgi:hypothetical protein
VTIEHEEEEEAEEEDEDDEEEEEVIVEQGKVQIKQEAPHDKGSLWTTVRVPLGLIIVVLFINF